jgi:hypothetical protein
MSEWVAEGDDIAEDRAKVEKKLASEIKAPRILERQTSRFPPLSKSFEGLPSPVSFFPSCVTPSISTFSTCNWKVIASA